MVEMRAVLMAASMVAPKADQLAEYWAVLKVARTVVKKADWTIEGMVVLKSDNLDIKMAALMAASMVPRRVGTRGACWVETMDIEFVAKKADWTVEGMVVLKADCLDMMRAVLMVASMVPRRVETKGACWVETTAAKLVVKKTDWTVEGMVVLKADCLDIKMAVLMAASMVPRRVETRGACWVEMTALYSGKQKVCWKAAATVAAKAD